MLLVRVIAETTAWHGGGGSSVPSNDSQAR